MCIPSFDEFIANNPKYKKFEGSLNARNVYDYLKVPENIEKMISSNNNGKPALYGVQADIEVKFAGFSDFDFNVGFVKQCVGSMVRDIIEPLGFKTLLQRDLPKNESIYFKSAAHYSFDESIAKCKLVKNIEIIKIEQEECNNK